MKEMIKKAIYIIPGFAVLALAALVLTGALPRALYAASVWALEQNQIQPAKILALGAKSTNTGSAHLHFLLGKHFKNLKAYEESLIEFRNAAGRDPYYPGVNLEIGRFVSLGFISQAAAIEYFTKEIEISNHPYAYHMRGLMHGFRGDWEKAEKDFRSATSLARSWASYVDLGWTLLAQDKIDEAELAVKRALEIEQNFWGLSGLGVIALNQGDLANAISLLEKAVEQGKILTKYDYWRAYPGNDPRGAERGVLVMRAGAHFNLALAHERAGRYQGAIAQYEEYLRLAREAAGPGIGPRPPVPQRAVEERVAQLNLKINNNAQ